MLILAIWNAFLTLAIICISLAWLQTRKELAELSKPTDYFDIKALDENGAVISQGRDNIMSTIQDTQKVTVTIAAKSLAGNVVALADKPVWQTSDASVATVSNISEDGMTADVVSTGKVGSATITFEAEKTAGDAASVIKGSYDVTVVGGEAALLAVVGEVVSAK